LYVSDQIFDRGIIQFSEISLFPNLIHISELILMQIQKVKHNFSPKGRKNSNFDSEVGIGCKNVSFSQSLISNTSISFT
jgi:hypothetical protein